MAKNRPVKCLLDIYEPGEGKTKIVDKPSTYEPNSSYCTERPIRPKKCRNNVGAVWLWFTYQ